MKSTSVAQPPRIALVGAGAIAQSYVTAFEDTSAATLVAVADLSAAAAFRIAERSGARTFSSHEELLAWGGCDAVIICTPPAFHMEVAIDALQAGAHVLCEKPLAIGAFSARRMFAVADAAGRILTMASKFRFVDDIQRARGLMMNGTIGDVVRVDNIFMAVVDMTERWNSRASLSGGGVLIDNGTHSADILRYLLGPLAAVHAVDTSTDPRYTECDDSANAFVRSASGTIGSIALSWSLGTSDPSFLRIHGSAGVIDVGWRASSYALKGETATAFGSGYDKRAAFRRQIEDFAGAVTGTNAPAISPADAISSVETIDAAYASMWGNAWREIEVRRPAPAARHIERRTASVS